MTRLEQRILDAIQREVDIDTSGAETHPLPEEDRRPQQPKSPARRPVGPSDSFLDLVELSPGKQSSTVQARHQKTSRLNMHISAENVGTQRSSLASSGKGQAGLLMLGDPKEASLNSVGDEFGNSDRFLVKAATNNSVEAFELPSSAITEVCFKFAKTFETLMRRIAYFSSFQHFKVVLGSINKAHVVRDSTISIHEGNFPINLSGTAPKLEIFQMTEAPRKFGRMHDHRTDSLRCGTASSPIVEKRSIIASFSDRDTQNSLHKYLPCSPKEAGIPVLAFNQDEEQLKSNSRGFLNTRALNSPTTAAESLTSRPGLNRFGTLADGTSKTSRIHFGLMSPQELYIPHRYNQQLKDSEAWHRFNQTALYYDQLSRRLDDTLKSSDKTKFSGGVLRRSQMAETPKSDLKGLLARLQESNQQLPQTSMAAFGAMRPTHRFMTPQKEEGRSHSENTQDVKPTLLKQPQVKSPRGQSRPPRESKITQGSAHRGLRESHSSSKPALERCASKSRSVNKRVGKDLKSSKAGQLSQTQVPVKDIICKVPFTPKSLVSTPKQAQKGIATRISKLS